MIGSSRLLAWSPRLLLGFGLIAIAVAVATAVSSARFTAGAERADGIVVEVLRSSDSEGDSFRPLVRFTTPDGEQVEFASTVSSSTPSVSPGDHVEVFYDPDNPSDARLTGFFDLWGLPAVIGFIGVIFAGLGWVLRGRFRVRSEADRARLRAQGLHLTGASPRVMLDASIAVNGQSPFRVVVDVQDPGRNEVRVLDSEAVWFDPAPYLAGRKTLDVYVDPQRPDDYLVDLSFLPRVAE